MGRPVWFHATRWGSVPVHWTPVAWQGWLIVALLTLGLVGAMMLWAATAPGRVAWVGCALVAVTIVVAALTDEIEPSDTDAETNNPRDVV